MAYVTMLQLAERPGALELAQVASDPQRPVVDADLMDATLRELPRTAWTTEQVAAADNALWRIADAVADADGRIDGFLSRAGYALPLAPVPSIVSGWSRDIARYLLHKDRISDERTDPIARAYRDAMKLLELTAAGKFNLGVGDPQAPAAGGDAPQVAAPAPVWSADKLADF